MGNKIVMNKGVPTLGTKEFGQWLKDYHAEHNDPRKRDEREAELVVVRITDKGRRKLGRKK